MDTTEWSGQHREALCEDPLSTGEEEVDNWLVSPGSSSTQPCAPAPVSSTLQMLVSTPTLATSWQCQGKTISSQNCQPPEVFLFRNAPSDATPDNEAYSPIWTPPAETTPWNLRSHSPSAPLSFPLLGSFTSLATSAVSAKTTHRKLQPANTTPASIRRKGRKPNPIACFFCSEVVPYKRTFIHHLRDIHGIRRSQSLMYKRLNEGSEAIKRRYCGPRRIFKVTLIR